MNLLLRVFGNKSFDLCVMRFHLIPFNFMNLYQCEGNDHYALYSL